MENINRKEIQIMRGMGIILVSIHHAINNLPTNLVGNTILAVANSDVVFFFVISGFLYELKHKQYREEPKKFFMGKMKQLLIPYFFWSSILYIGGFVCHYWIGGKVSILLDNLGFPAFSLKEIVVNLLTMNNYYVEHLWFIYALCWIFVINYFVLDKMTSITWVIMLLVAAITIRYYYDPPYLIWKLMKHYSDFLLGRVICKKNLESSGVVLSSKKIKVLLVFDVGAFLLISLTNAIEVYLGVLAIAKTILEHVFYWALVGTGYIIAKYFIKKNRSIMEILGNYSFEIYLMHTPYVIPVFAKLLNCTEGWYLIKLALLVVLGIAIPIIISKKVIYKHKTLQILMVGKTKSQ